MQAYDVFMIAVLAASVIWGAWKGLAWQVTSLGSIFVSYFVSSMGADWFTTNVLPKLFKPPPGTERYVSMLALYCISSLGIWMGFNFVRDFIERFKLKEFDRQIGALLGAAKGGLICVLVTLFTVGVSQPTTRDAVFRSYSGKVIARALDVMAPFIPGDFRSEIAPYVRKLEDGIVENDRFRRDEPPYADDRYADERYEGDRYGDERYSDDRDYRADDRYRDDRLDRPRGYGDADRAPYHDRYQDDYEDRAPRRADRYEDRSAGDRSRYADDYPGDLDASRNRRRDDRTPADTGEADEGLWNAVEKFGEKLLPEVQKAIQGTDRR